MKYNAEWPARRYDKMGEKEWFRLERDRRGELLYIVHWDILKRHIKSTDTVIELGAGAGKFTKDIANVCGSITTSDISPVQVGPVIPSYWFSCLGYY